jgi:hypothetical protein
MCLMSYKKNQRNNPVITETQKLKYATSSQYSIYTVLTYISFP